MSYLKDTEAAGHYDLAAAIGKLASDGGPGAWRQVLSLVALLLDRRKLVPEEYYTYALHRKDRGRAFIRDFISKRNILAFNTTLHMPDRGIDLVTLNDKLATEALLSGRGLPFCRTRAVFAPGSATQPDLPGLQVLRSAKAVAEFLANPANLPVFGKPRCDSFARGAVMIEGLAGPEVVRLLNGRTAPVTDLATEIAQDRSQGYLFQPFYACAPDLQPHAGAAMASLRIVTLWTREGIEPWYAVIRLPAATAMHDGDSKDPRIWGLVDLGSGKLVKLRSLRDPAAGDLQHGNDPSRPFLGTTLPHWPQAVEICVKGHESFPGHGLICWDVFLTADGAILSEANACPGHLYQVAAQRPLLNADMRPAYNRALAFARQHGGGRSSF